MGWPQIVIIVLLAMDVGLYLANHGKDKIGKYNFWIALISDGIFATILWLGGFWR